MYVCVNLKTQTPFYRKHRVSNGFVRTSLQPIKTKEIVRSTAIVLCTGNFSPLKVHKRWALGPKQYPKAQRTSYETTSSHNVGLVPGRFGHFDSGV